ncbi:membrane associated rhomboid family serine protease [Halopolyspora algeriensis]|uniref:Membrane associated rhomboid family serine protease n=1 Tax=Halopolyspora algeriensis TaxID=1500506 RepID=A0A368VYG3_9ACTN|nr:rhomboid family intramembrane serine protease [Halopolyspora algeriensis]RCW47246.1 membrane associated rhomboid family serine protease [Halopolyspora algeriensis]
MRCDRPVCPECLREASVGYQCVDCVAEGQRGTRHPVTVAGARLSTKPMVVPALIAINVLVHALTSVQAGNPMENFRSGLFEAWSLWPLPVADGQWWRLITSGFLHIGLLHLLVNMVALWIIGRDLEMVLGRVRFASVYLLSLLGGSTAVFLFGGPVNPVAGASGAVYGLMGGIAVAAFRLKLNLRPILMIIGINIVLTLSIPGISLFGHLGGLVLGLASTAALLYAPASRRTAWQFGSLAGLLVVLVVLLVTRDLQFGDVICDVQPDGRVGCIRLPG